MAQTLADLQAALTELSAAVQADKAQTAALVAAVNTLIAKIQSGTDVSAEVQAVAAIIADIKSDDAASQAAIDASASA